MDPNQRLSAEEALNHTWFKEKAEKDVVLDASVLSRLQKFRGVSKLKKAAMNMMVKMADQNAIEDLKEQFHKMDKDGTGMINADELKQAMIESSVEMPEEEIERIIESVDYVGNQMINYTEFLVATMDVK